MSELVRRHIEPLAREVNGSFPVVTIEGARQVGKSTLAALLIKDVPSLSVTLDDPATLAAARSDPSAFVLSAGRETLVIDEIQRAPELLLAIKASVDRDRRPGRFVITGSSDLLRLERTPDSLAGRAVTVAVRGFSQGELGRRSDDFVNGVLNETHPWRFETVVDRESVAERVTTGGYPEVQTLSLGLRRRWFDAYLTRIIQRDVTDVSKLTDPERLRGLLRLLAANQAGELVKSRYADAAGLAATSITRYLDVLRTLHLVDFLPPWTANLTQREVGRPKALVSDSGLATRLAGVDVDSLAAPLHAEHFGGLLEGFVVGELLKQREWSAIDYRISHYRDRNGREVDIIIELADGRLIAVEVKASSTYRPDHFKGLAQLADRLGERFQAGIVLGTSQNGLRFGDRLFGLPVSSLWEL